MNVVDIFGEKTKRTQRRNILLGDPGKRHNNDLYSTPPVATYALHVHGDPPERILEPAAGRGWMVNELIRCGHEVFAYDKYVDLDAPSWIGTQDFLTSSHDGRAEGVVTNPPFKSGLPMRFAELALSRYPYVALFCRLTFLESYMRRSLFERYPLNTMLIFSGRVNFTENRFNEKAGQCGGMVSYAWFIWDRRPRLSIIPSGFVRHVHVDTDGLYEAWRAETSNKVI